MFKKNKSISDDQFSPKAKKSMLKKFVNNKTGLVAGATIAAISVATYSMTVDMPNKTELYGQHYQTVVEKLEERGFTNIEMTPFNDLEYGQVDKSEVVELVKVNDDEWKDGSTWKSDTITVFYHTAFDDAVIPDIDVVSTYSEIETRLKSDGFNDITTTPILLLEEGNESKKAVQYFSCFYCTLVRGISSLLFLTFLIRQLVPYFSFYDKIGRTMNRKGGLVWHSYITNTGR